MIMSTPLGKTIRRIRTKLRKNQAEFADMLGTTQSTVSRWENSSKPEYEYLLKIADIANLTIEALVGEDEFALRHDGIPLVGYVGAGATVLPYDDLSQGGGMDTIERPPFITGRAVAVEVRGDSLFPTAENGWKLVYTGEQTFVEEDVLNRLCVVSLADGRMLVKRLLRGSQPGRYHLSSTNAPLIENAEIVWAARVKAIVPE